MSIPLNNVPPRSNNVDPSVLSALVSEEVELQSKKRRLRIKKSNVNKIARGLAEIAFSMGETNDVEAYTDAITSAVFSTYEMMARKSLRKKNG